MVSGKNIDEVKIVLVNGEKVRSKEIDFALGGHAYRYPKLIPENEIWIESSLKGKDKIATIVHELVERSIIKMRGMKYDKAHTKFANAVEKDIRSALKGVGTMKGIGKFEYPKIDNSMREAFVSDDNTLYRKWDESGKSMSKFISDEKALIDSTIRKWALRKYKHRVEGEIEARRLLKRCGDKCYLDPNKSNPEYGVCSTNCSYSCTSIAAAYRRAIESKHNKIAKKALQLAKSQKCKSPKGSLMDRWYQWRNR